MTDRAPYPDMNNGETIFTVPASTIKFGPGALNELGDDARRLGMTRAALFTDEHVVETEPVKTALDALTAAGVNTVVYDAVKVEPTGDSLRTAAQFASEGNFDGYISLGGGSVIDTCKIANLIASYPEDLLTYVNAPIGAAKPVPGPIKPHIACPTTCGTGSETTGVAVFDLVEQQVKTGISSIYLRPPLALVDPVTTDTMPAGVIAATGFDVLTHAIESYTARNYTTREKPTLGTRPPYQGANPFSDIGSDAAIRIGGQHLVDAATDPDNTEARYQLMFAATLAGQAFGNAGVHIPHAMSYSVAGLNHEYIAKGYENDNPMVPHGLSVVINAPAAFRFTGPANPERHLMAADALGADISNASPADGGEILARRLIDMMRATGLPSGLAEIGYGEDDIPALVKGCYAQKRLLAQTPCPVSEQDLAGIYRDAMKYW
jgi:hydroxyacid-oxoacid transhydrogenase